MREETVLLDWLLVAAENLRLLVMVPVVAALIAAAVTFALPGSYESTALIKGTPQMRLALTSAEVLDPLLQELRFQRSDESLESARIRLRESIQTSFDPRDTLVKLTVKASSPEAAQAMAKSLLQIYSNSSKPRGAELKRMQVDLATTEDLISETSETLRLFNMQIRRAKAPIVVDVAQGYAMLISTLESLHKRKLDLLRELEGTDESALLQSPTLDRTERGLKRASVVAFVLIGCFVFLVFFVFIRHAVRAAALDEKGAIKLAAIRAALLAAIGKG